MTALSARTAKGGVHTSRSATCSRDLIGRRLFGARRRTPLQAVAFASAADNSHHFHGKLLQQSASNPGVPEQEFMELVARVRERGNAFCFELDADMNRLEQSADASEPRRRTGIGIYMYADPPRTASASSRTIGPENKAKPFAGCNTSAEWDPLSEWPVIRLASKDPRPCPSGSRKRQVRA
jgi:hypothetical protein